MDEAQVNLVAPTLTLVRARPKPCTSPNPKGKTKSTELPMQTKAIARINIPMLYNPHIRGLEDSPELILDEGTLIAGR